MAKIKAASTNAIANIKRTRELMDIKNNYIKEYNRQLQNFYDNMKSGNKKNRSFREKKKFIDVPMAHEASAYAPLAKYSKKK